MLKRTPFKSKAPPRPPRAPLVPLRPEVTAALERAAGKAHSAFAGGVPKRDYVRSTLLMAAYRSIPCQHCGIDDGTVCGSHSNWAAHGKAKARKSDDNRCASLCFRCHSGLDQGSGLTIGERKNMWWAAHIKTIGRLLADGLWPVGVPVPDIDDGGWM